MRLNPKLREKITESLSAVLPVTGIVLALSILVVPIDLGTIAMFLIGAVLLVIGMGFFQLGAEMAMEPLGDGVGVEIAKTRKIVPAVLIGFAMGMLITISEPDLQVLAEQVPSIPNMVLIMTVAVGVGIFLAIAICRILFKVSLSTILIVLYTLILLLAFLVPEDFLAVAFDAGGVTTGPMTVPFIMALGVGLASVRSDKDAAEDSFGLVALSSVGPVVAVLLLGIFYHPESTEYAVTEVAQVETTRDVFVEFLKGLPQYIREVLISLLPVVAVYFIFQAFTHRYRKSERKRILVGFIYTYIGLALFLCGVNIGFSPVGTYLGNELASGNMKWLLIPVGMLIGYYIVKAEPAIQVLGRQVETVTNGAVSEKSMNTCMSIGVSISVGLSMLRVLTGMPIECILIPGYIIALVLSRIVPKMFVGIAFDSGGVASGPMTTTFLLPLSLGACYALGGNIMTDAFGVVALVALTPLIAVQIMGLQYKFKMRKAQQMNIEEIFEEEEPDDILDFEEDEEDG